MKLNFHKYQANGNDFIIFNNFSNNLPKEQEFIKKLCSRKFNVGADGVIFVENCESHDYEMLYFNSDGKLGSLCGNGARCCAKFAFDQGLIKNRTNFMPINSKMTTSQLWFNLLPVIASLLTVIFSVSNTFLYMVGKIINS